MKNGERRWIELCVQAALVKDSEERERNLQELSAFARTTLAAKGLGCGSQPWRSIKALQKNPGARNAGTLCASTHESAGEGTNFAA